MIKNIEKKTNNFTQNQLYTDTFANATFKWQIYFVAKQMLPAKIIIFRIVSSRIQLFFFLKPPQAPIFFLLRAFFAFLLLLYELFIKNSASETLLFCFYLVWFVLRIVVKVYRIQNRVIA